MPRQGPPRLPAGERDRRLAEEVLYLHSLWHRGGPVPAPAPTPAPAPAAAPIQFRSTRHEGRDPRGLHRLVRRREDQRLVLYRLLSGNGRKRPRIDPAAAEPGPSSRETLAETAGDPTPPAGNPPAPTTPLGPLAQRKAVRSSSVNFSAADDDDEEGSDSEGEKAVEEEAARYFTALFEQDAFLRGHYKERWRKGRFQCLVCAAGAGGGKTVVGKRVRRHGNCVALVHHLREASRRRSRYWNYRKRGAHRGLGVVVCRMFGWDFHSPHLKAVLRHAKKQKEDARENNGDSTDDASYTIDEDEESEYEETEGEEEDIETWMLPDPDTDGDEEDSEIESDEEYAEKEAANSIARKQDMEIRDCLLRLTHAKSMDTTPKETEVHKRSHVPKYKEVSTPGSKFNEGSDKAKRKVSASSYQSLKSNESRVVKKMKVNQQPSNKGKQSKTNETGASARKAKRPAVAARKAKQLANKQLAKKPKKQLAKKRKVDVKTLENTHRS